MRVPKRMAIERKPGAKLPRSAVFVGKGSRWACPWPAQTFSAEERAARYRPFILEIAERDWWLLESLRGCDLADYPPLGEWSPADTLLDLCNSDGGKRMMRPEELIETGRATKRAG